jgi:gas vesicle protein
MNNDCAKGFIWGSLLTAVAGAVAFFALSKDGKELTGKLKEEVRQKSLDLKDKFGRLRTVTKEDFEELVTILVDEYAKKKELNEETKNRISRFLKAKWSEIKEDIISEV